MKSNALWPAIVLVSAGAVFSTQAAFAADPSSDLYIGGSVTLKRTNNLGGKIDSSLSNQGLASTTSASSSSTNPSLHLGYRLNPNFAVEATYDRVGSLSLNSAITSPAADTAVGSWKSRGLGIHVLGIQPIDQKLSVYGRLGVEQWRTSLNLASNVAGATNVNTTGSNMSLVLGAGAAYALTPAVDVTGELTRYNRVGNASTTGQAGLNSFNIGLRYHFM